MHYPKINTLFKRDDKHNIIEGDFSCPEFDAIEYWHVTEKIDGTNIRIMWQGHTVVFGGKTDNAMISTTLLTTLQATFTKEKMAKQFGYNKVVLFGEGYGGKIQRGRRYSIDEKFILFDANINDFWLEPAKVLELAQQLGVDYVPVIVDTAELDCIVRVVREGIKSGIADTHAEGVVCRSVPLMLFRKDKTPIMWKLKVKDYGN
jgi:RNA ligase